MNIECLHNAQCSEVWNQWAAALLFLDILLISYWMMVCFWPWPYQSIHSERNTDSGFIKGYQISGAPWVTQMRFSELSMVMSPDTLYRARSSMPILFIEYCTGLWNMQRSFGHGSLLVDKVKTLLRLILMGYLENIELRGGLCPGCGCSSVLTVQWGVSSLHTISVMRMVITEETVFGQQTIIQYSRHQ